jgi:sugar-phosphatase
MPVFLCSAILFDLDGVLVDSTRSVSYQWLTWAEQHNIPPETMLPIMHGRRTVEVVQLAAPQLDAEAEAKILEERGAHDHERVELVPGVAELLASLPPDRWAVVTSATRYVAEIRLRHFNLPFPRVLVTADDVSLGKPDPAPYLRGAALLGIKPAECMVVEDAPAGIASAHAGGMKAIGITSTFPASHLTEADAVVSAFARIRVTRIDGRLEIRC